MLMKVNFTRSLLALIALAGSATLNAQDVKILSFKVDQSNVGKEMTFLISATDEQSVQVDWGNGTKSDPVKVLNVSLGDLKYTDLTGKIEGAEVTIYGADAATINSIKYEGGDVPLTALDMTALSGVTSALLSNNNIAALDLSNCAALKTLEAANNALTTLTMPTSADNVLASIDVSNTVTDGVVTKGSNEVLGSNWGAASKLTSLKVSGNTKLKMITFLKWETFDISKNTELATLEMNGSKQSKVDISKNTKLKTFRANYNQFETLNASNMLANASISANNNLLTSISIPEGFSGTLEIKDNYFSFATLPAYTPSSAYKYKFAPQATISAAINGENVVDLSAQAKVGETASTFVWKIGETALVEGTDYTVANGVFTFLKDVKDAYCEIQNAFFYKSNDYNKLTLTTAPVTSPNLIPQMMTLGVKLVDNKTAAFSLATSSEAGMDVYVDWGDGVKAGPYKVTSSTTEITSAAKGATIKVYGDPELITTFSASAGYNFNTTEFSNLQIESIDLSLLVNLSKLTLNQGLISTIDLSNNKALTTIELQANKITAFDFDLPKLTSLDLSNAAKDNVRALGDNKPAITDFSKYPALTTYIANFTGINVDFTNTGTITTLRLIGNELESVDLSKPTNVTSIVLNYNNLTSLNATGVKANASLFLLNNKLTSLTLPEAMTGSVNISNNCFTFATLPAAWSKLTYSPQADVEATVADGKVDLSAQAKVGETATAFAWADGETALVEGTDYTVENGVFTFLKDAEKAVCTMTNADFAKLTLKTVELNIKAAGIASIEADENAPVEYYDLRGVRVSGDAPGIYIRRQGNKATKVLVK